MKLRVWAAGGVVEDRRLGLVRPSDRSGVTRMGVQEASPLAEILTMNTYRVTLTHPKLDGPLVGEMLASTEHAAITRLRSYAFHAYRCADMLTADAHAVVIDAEATA